MFDFFISTVVRVECRVQVLGPYLGGSFPCVNCEFLYTFAERTAKIDSCRTGGVDIFISSLHYVNISYHQPTIIFAEPYYFKFYKRGVYDMFLWNNRFLPRYYR